MDKGKLMGKSFFITICFILMNIISLTAKENLLVKIGTYENSPKIFTAENGEISGFWADITKDIAKRANWKIQWIHGSWDQCLQRLENNEIDIMIDVALTPSRQNKFAFSNKTVLLSWVRIYKKKDSDIQTILDLEGKTIAGLKGSFDLNGPEGLKEITSKFKINCNIIEMEHYNDIFYALENSKIDAGIVDKDFGNIHNDYLNIEKTPIILQPAYMHFAFSKNAKLTPYLIQEIDSQIEELKKNNNSIYYHSIDKYLSGQKTKILFPLWLKITILAIFSITIISLIFIVILKHQVNKKTAQLQQSEKQFRLFAENIPGVVSIYEIFPDGHRRYIYEGPGLENLLGKKLAKIITNNKDEYYKLIPEQDYQKLQKASLKALERCENLDFVYRLRIDNSHTKWVRALFNLMKKENGVILCQGIIYDVTERKLAEQKLKEKSLELEKLYKNSEKQRKATLLMLKDLNKLTKELKAEIIQRKQAEKVQKALYNISNAVNTTDNINDLYIKIRFFLGDIIDVTNFFVALYDKKTDTLSLPFHIVEKDKLKTLSADKTLVKYVISTGKSLFATNDVIDDLTQKGIIKTIENPAKIWMGVPLIIDGTIIGAIAVQSYNNKNLFSKKDIDILSFVSEEIAIATKRKQTNEKLKKNLEIQTALIQEIYHRTKNNMAVISAMLSIQSRQSDNEFVKSTFREIRNKIQAMSLVHQKLYKAKDLSNIDLKEYIEDLTNLIMRSYSLLSKNIKVKFDLQKVIVSIDSAIPLGLILNELISNVFKHAFPKNKEGEIFIRLFKKKDDTINLEIIDNGIGLPKNFDPRENGSIGMISVFSLVEKQLKGKVSVISDNGLKWHIKICDEKKERI